MAPHTAPGKEQLLLAGVLLMAVLATGLGCLQIIKTSIASMNKLPLLPVTLWGIGTSVLLGIAASILLWRGSGVAVKTVAGIAFVSATITLVCLLRFFVPAIFLTFAT